MKFNPLHKWEVEKTKCWIKAKKVEYDKYRGSFRADVSEMDIELPTEEDLDLDL